MTRKSSARRAARERRRKKLRRMIRGVEDRPRLSVFRSIKHTYAQLIDDTRGITLISASTVSEDVKKEMTNGATKTDSGRAVGKVLARKALEKGIKKVRFDRGGYLYHGRIKALADAAREGGLEF